MVLQRFGDFQAAAAHVADKAFGPVEARDHAERRIMRLFRSAQDLDVAAGPLRDRLWPEFDVHPGDLLVEKSAASAFFPGRSPLPELLAARSVNTVLITGTVTNVCCESSARDAKTLGYRVIMVADANAGVADECHNATLHTIYRSFDDVRPTCEVLELIERGAAGPPPR